MQLHDVSLLHNYSSQVAQLKNGIGQSVHLNLKFLRYSRGRHRTAASYTFVAVINLVYLLVSIFLIH